MLDANPRFQGAHVEESSRAKDPACRYFVCFLPAAIERQAEMLSREQSARAARAAEQEFTFELLSAPDTWLCLSHHSGNCYVLAPGRCTCPDFTYRCAGTGMSCKHMIALDFAAHACSGAEEEMAEAA